MSKIWKRPTLVVIDVHNHRANRYVPKLIGGFFRETANIGHEQDGPPKGLGSEEGLEIIERFRTGQMAGQVHIEDQPQPEAA